MQNINIMMHKCQMLGFKKRGDFFFHSQCFRVSFPIEISTCFNQLFVDTTNALVHF